MSDRVNLLRRVDSLNKSPEFNGITKLICNIDDETQMTVGDDTGYALEFENPMMTQSTLTAMLNKIRGYQYQPYTADGALLDPAAEMGDAVSIRDLYGGIFTRSRSFGRLMKADISAPADEEIDHEYKFETKQERKVKRQFGDVRATLLVQAGQISAEVAQREADSAEFRGQLEIQATEIAARVTQTGGNNSSFGWSLLADEFGLYAGNTKVFYVNRNGAYVNGEIRATTGKIGGFTIGSNAIYNNLQSYGGSQSTGVYLGTNGIQLGQNFKVDTSGNITANNVNVKGRIYTQARDIQYGGSNGTVSAGALTDRSIGSSKYGGGSVNNSALGNSSVSYGKTSFQGTLDQVGINKSNIETINGYFTGSAHFSSLTADTYWLSGKALYFDTQNYVRGRSYD